MCEAVSPIPTEKANMERQCQPGAQVVPVTQTSGTQEAEARKSELREESLGYKAKLSQKK